VVREVFTDKTTYAQAAGLVKLQNEDNFPGKN